MFYMSANGGGAVSAESSCLFWLFYHDYRFQKLVNLCMLIENVRPVFFFTCNGIFLSLEYMDARTDTNTKNTMINLLPPLTW